MGPCLLEGPKMKSCFEVFYFFSLHCVYVEHNYQKNMMNKY